MQCTCVLGMAAAVHRQLRHAGLHKLGERRTSRALAGCTQMIWRPVTCPQHTSPPDYKQLRIGADQHLVVRGQPLLSQLLHSSRPIQ